MIRRLVRALGLVPHGELQAVEEELRAARQRLEEAAALEERIAALEQKLRERDRRTEAAAREEATLEARVAEAMRELDRARADLTAVEVKLDILEGAANVLDARLRTARPLPVTSQGAVPEG